MTTVHAFERGVGVILAAALAGCGTSITTSLDEIVLEVIEETTFAAALDIDLADFTRLETGVYIQDEVVGTGDAAVFGTRANLTFVGWLSDGTQFDSGPFEFLLGNSETILGFEQAILGMRSGGVRRMVIPPALAYGVRGSGPVPGGAIVIYRVELVDVT
jgi:peptidylprolyl isomerase